MKKHFLSLFLIFALLMSFTSVYAAPNISEEDMSAVDAKGVVCDEIFSDIYAELDLEKMYESAAPGDYAGIYADENGNIKKNYNVKVYGTNGWS